MNGHRMTTRELHRMVLAQHKLLQSQALRLESLEAQAAKSMKAGLEYPPGALSSQQGGAQTLSRAGLLRLAAAGAAGVAGASLAGIGVAQAHPRPSVSALSEPSFVASGLGGGGTGFLADEPAGFATGAFIVGSGQGVFGIGNTIGVHGFASFVNGSSPGIGVVGESTETGRAPSLNNIGVLGFGDGAGVQGQGNNGAPGVVGVGVPAVTGIAGTSAANVLGTGVLGTSSVSGTAPSPSKVGVLGFGDSVGVQGIGHGGGLGVQGVSSRGAGVRGLGVKGGSFQGTSVTLHLDPPTSSTVGSPTKGSHVIGDVLIDSNGNLFVCVAKGRPGVWKQIRYK